MTDKKLYAVALPGNPLINGMEIPRYNQMEKVGTIFATSPGAAISQYLHRRGIREVLGNKERSILIKMIRDDLGGYDNHTLEIDNDYAWEDGNMTPEEIERAQEVELANFFHRVYGTTGQSSTVFQAISGAFVRDHLKSKSSVA